jgi:hypothetical protein
MPDLRDKGNLYDPMDADDYAVIKENTESREVMQEEPHMIQMKETANENNQGHHKKIKIVTASTEAVIYLEKKESNINEDTQDIHHIATPKRYEHLYSREISPPPRIA